MDIEKNKLHILMYATQLLKLIVLLVGDVLMKVIIQKNGNTGNVVSVNPITIIYRFSNWKFKEFYTWEY